MAADDMPEPASGAPQGHPEIRQERVGVLLVNLGTPEGTDYRSVRRYLSEFLSDRRVVELSPWLWQPLLQGIVLTVRPRRSGRNYARIWNRERDESPLRTFTRAQGARLGERFSGEDLVVDWAMRYGRPSIAERLDALAAQGCRRILLAPLYPQYSAATTATACDQAFRHLRTMRWQPAVRTLPAYFDEPAYIAALAGSVREELARLPWEPEVLLVSFHGLPKQSIEKGDPYHGHCQETARLLREALGWPEKRLRIVFQSRFGPTEWLQPYADVTAAELARQGVRRLAVVSPGFAVDCVETLEELDIGLRAIFLEAGGESFAYLPCLNDSARALDLLEGLTRRELAGWLAAEEKLP